MFSPVNHIDSLIVSFSLPGYSAVLGEESSRQQEAFKGRDDPSQTFVKGARANR